MKVVPPTRLLGDAADILDGIRDHVVIVGAAALEVALLDAADSTITPTRDVDMVICAEAAQEVIAHLEASGMQPSDLPYEKNFTWVRYELKVQLVRSFRPFPSPSAKKLPENPVFDLAANPAHQVEIAFEEHPDQAVARLANSACLLALKQAAFGRRRPPENSVVQRDYHDAYLLVSSVAESILEELARADSALRRWAEKAVLDLASGAEPTRAAARQMVELGQARTQRAAEAEVRRAANRMQKLMKSP